MNIADMECPHGWINCQDCENVRLCLGGLYKPEIDIVEVAKEKEKEEIEEAVKIIERGNEAKPYTDLERFYSLKSMNLHYKEPIPLDGPSAPGGSKSGKSKKSKKGTKVFVGVWEGV